MAAAVFAVVDNLHPAGSDVAGVFGRWIIAERNALHRQLSMWQKLKQYINWERVHADLCESR